MGLSLFVDGLPVKELGGDQSLIGQGKWWAALICSMILTSRQNFEQVPYLRGAEIHCDFPSKR